MKSRARSTPLSTRTHMSNGSFTSTPLTQSSIFASCASTASTIGLARRHSRRRIHLPDLASSHLMISLVVRPGAKLPLSPTTFCVLPRGRPIRSRRVLVMAELDGIIVLPCRCHEIFIFPLPLPHICASVRSETLTAVIIIPILLTTKPCFERRSAQIT